MTVTTIVIYAVLGIALIYDAFALNKSYESTISWTLYSGAKKYPIIAFLFGIAFGHLFWPVAGPGGVPADDRKPCEVIK